MIAQKDIPILSGRKVAVIGAGYVGSSIVYSLMIKGLTQEIVLIEQEKNAEKCIAEINDIRHGIPYMGSSNIYLGTYADIKNSDLIIVTAGRNRLPNESRLDLTIDSTKIANSVANEIKKHYNTGVILIVTNPVDIIVQKFTEWLELPQGIVFGTGCLLDSSRLTNIIADYIGLRSDVITANVIGEHGDSQIALWSKVSIAGIPIDEYYHETANVFDFEKRKEIETQVIQMGTSIIKSKGRTHYGIATCVCYIADAILNRRPTIASVSSTLKGEYGITDVALSLRSIIGTHGVESKFEDRLSDLEYTRLKDTENRLKEYLQLI